MRLRTSHIPSYHRTGRVGCRSSRGVVTRVGRLLQDPGQMKFYFLSAHAHEPIVTFLVLNTCRRAHGAGYRLWNRTSCLKGTQENALYNIERWIEILASLRSCSTDLPGQWNPQLHKPSWIGSPPMITWEHRSSAVPPTHLPALMFQLVQTYPVSDPSSPIES